MRLRINQKIFITLAMLLLASENALALKIYQWTDADGVVQYSDTPPPGDASSEVKESELVNLSGDDADSDEYSIVNQLEQMIAWRRQAEEDQRAWKLLQLEEERLAQEKQATQPPADINTDTYYPQIIASPAYYHPYTPGYPRYTQRHGLRGRSHDHHNGGGSQWHRGRETTGYYSYK